MAILALSNGTISAYVNNVLMQIESQKSTADQQCQVS